MTDPSPPAEKPDPQPAATPKKAKKKGRWRRRFKWFAVVLILLIAAIRVGMVMALPRVLASTAAGYNLQCTYERLELSIIDGNVGLVHLDLAPREGGSSYAHADYCRLNISMIDLLRGRLVVYRVETDAARLTIERDADGTLPLLKRLATAKATQQPKPAVAQSVAEATSAKPPVGTAPDFSSPLTLDALVVTHVRAHIIDRSVTPILDTEVMVNMRLSDLASPKRPTRFELEVGAPPVLDVMRIEGEGRGVRDSLTAAVRVAVAGVHLKSVAPYLQPLGIRPVASDLSMHCDATVQVSPTTLPAAPGSPPRAAIKGTLALKQVSLTADGEEAAGIDRVEVDANWLDPRDISLAKLLVQGVRCQAEHTASGHLLAAGLELAPPAPTTAPTSQPVTLAISSTRPSGVSTPPATQPATPLRVAVRELVLRDVGGSFVDSAITPAAQLGMRIEQLTLSDFLLDPDHPEAAITIAGELRAPRLAGDIRIAGTLHPFSAKKTVDLKLDAGHIRPDALRPYLDAMGIESQLNSASFSCALSADLEQSTTGVVAANARLTDIAWRDGRDLLKLDEVSLAGFQFDPKANLVHMASVRVKGPQTAAGRDAASLLGGMGFRLKPASRVGTAHQPSDAAPPSRVGTAHQPADGAPSSPGGQPANGGQWPPYAATPAPPKIQIDHFLWDTVRVRFDDATASPPAVLELADAGVELTDLRLDLDPAAPATRPTTIRAWAVLPGLAGRLDVAGTVTPSPTGPALSLDIKGTGLKSDAASSYLRGLPIEPTLRDGSLDLHVDASISRADGKTRASLAVKNLALKDSGEELLGLDALGVRDLVLAPGQIEAPDIQIDRPRLRIVREKAGTPVVAGIRLIAPATQPAASVGSGLVEQSRDQRQALAPASPAPKPTSQPAAMIAILKRLRLKDAAIRWTDLAASPTVNTTAHASLDLDNLVYGKPAPPAHLVLTLAADGALDKLTVTGDFTPSPTAPSATFAIAATGLRPGPLAPYLPPGITSHLKDGRLRLSLDAGLSPNRAGGQAAKLIVNAFDYRDGQAEAPLLAFDSARVIIPRLDLPRTVAIEEVSLTGLQTQLTRNPDGMDLLGLNLGPAPKAQAPAAPPVQNAQPPTPGPAPASPVPSRPARKQLPLITLSKLLFNIKQFTLIDPVANSTPIIVSSFYFWNAGPIEVLGEDAEARPPVDLRLSCSVAPVLKDFELSLRAAPFAAEPNLTLSTYGAGLRGDGLTSLAPQLKSRLDASELTDGTFWAFLQTSAKIDRRSPIEIDLARGLEADVLLKGPEFRASATGRVLAGIEEIHADGMRIVPHTGSVFIKSLEITKPTAYITRDAAGLHALGMSIKLPPKQPAPTTAPAEVAEAQPATAPATAVAVPPVPSPADNATARADAPPVGAPPAPKPAGEIRIDKLTLSGLDFTFEDRTTDPVTFLPLTGLDLEAAGLSSRAPYEDRPMRFSLFLASGKVPLPKPQAGGLIGVLSSSATQPTMEERELFSQIMASGLLSLFPKPNGFVKSSVSGLELYGLKGPAQAASVNLGGGVFDCDVDLRLENGNMRTNSRLAFTDLRAKEPSNGPIARILHLRAPLDEVIVLLQDAAGTITIPVSLSVNEGKVSRTEVAGAAVNAIASVIAKAILSAPLKVVGGVGSIIGIGGGDKKPDQEQPIILDFAPGYCALAPAESAKLDTLARRLREQKNVDVTIQHDLAAGDIGRLAILANPSPEDALAIATRLRAHKRNLLGQRSLLAGQARALLASATEEETAPILHRLRAIDQDLADTEDALDRSCDMLRPGADRQAERRTRAAALQVAQLRLDYIRAALSTGLPDSATRIRATPPQFSPSEDSTGGRIVILPVVKKAPGSKPWYWPF